MEQREKQGKMRGIATLGQKKMKEACEAVNEGKRKRTKGSVDFEG